MEPIKFNREIAHLALLQRIELADPFLKKIRKRLGRYLFSNVFSKFFINPEKLSKKYYELFLSEYNSLKNFFKDNQNILTIGGGIGGLELLIMKNFKKTKIDLIEKNYISNKIKYGWDNDNVEAYNKLSTIEDFFKINGVDSLSFKTYDFDKNIFPEKKYDLIISLYSLDYHYDFNLYQNFLNKVSNQNSKIIFDTIRPDYFNTLFDSVEILKEGNSTIHKSKRIICSNFKK